MKASGRALPRVPRTNVRMRIIADALSRRKRRRRQSEVLLGREAPDTLKSINSNRIAARQQDNSAATSARCLHFEGGTPSREPNAVHMGLRLTSSSQTDNVTGRRWVLTLCSFSIPNPICTTSYLRKISWAYSPWLLPMQYSLIWQSEHEKPLEGLAGAIANYEKDEHGLTNKQVDGEFSSLISALICTLAKPGSNNHTVIL